MANGNSNYRSYGDESSSVVVDPGPWLPRLTIGYLILLVVLLHPFTMLIRKMRKDRKLKSAMARRKALNMRHDDNDVTAKHELAVSPSGSSSGHTSTLSAASSDTPSPSSHGNGPKMAIEMGTFGDDDGYDNKNKKDRVLVDLDDDNASVYVPVTLPIQFWTKICCRIISAYSGFTFVAVDEEKGHRRWQPSIDAAAVSKIESNSLGQNAERTFGLKKELGLV